MDNARHPNCIYPICGCGRQSDCKSDPMNTPLPCDVVVEGDTFLKGVKLGAFVTAARRWRAEAKVAHVPGKALHVADVVHGEVVMREEADRLPQGAKLYLSVPSAQAEGAMPNRLLTPRDWQAEAMVRAAKLSGTDEGAAALVEAKRYGALADEIESLRSRVAEGVQGAAK